MDEVKDTSARAARSRFVSLNLLRRCVQATGMEQGEGILAGLDCMQLHIMLKGLILPVSACFAPIRLYELQKHAKHAKTSRCLLVV